MVVRESIDRTLALAFEAHEASVAQKAQLVAYRRGAHARHGRKIADAQVFARQGEQDAQAGGVRKSREDICDRLDAVTLGLGIENPGNSLGVNDRGVTTRVSII